MAEDSVIQEVQGTQEDCSRLALEVARDTSRESFPVRVFQQGPRKMVAGVLPIRILLRVLATNAALKGMTAAGAAVSANRPVDTKHVQGITDYLIQAIRENREYILPPLTLNATQGLEIYVPKGTTTPVTGWAILPEDQFIMITDGQHRFLALRKVHEMLRGTEEGSRFLGDGLAVMVTISERAEQIHQDFADAAKTKALPPSLVAVYDTRHPGNRAVLRLVEKVELLRDRVDATSSTLSINSPYLFLANQVRQFVKSSLSGRPSLSDGAFYEQATHALTNGTAFDQWLESRATFLDVLTELIPEWKEIAALPRPQGPEGPVVLSKMREIRSRQPVSMSAAALNALGLVSYEVLLPLMSRGRSPERSAVADRLAPLASVDWDRRSPMWQGSLVQEGVIKTQTTAVNTAARVLLDLLDGSAGAHGARVARSSGTV